MVGLRPTYNLLSLEGIIAYDKERDVVGPMTKNVTDNAILMTILANNNIDYTKSLKQDGLKGKKIGVLTEFMEQEASSLRVLSYYHEPTNLMMKQAIAKMKEAGASIVYIDQFYSSHYQSLNDNSLMGSLMCYDFNQYIKNTSSDIKSYE